jgi:protein-tyrosine phosphatase
MKILFVCTANICRSPTAEGVFRKLVAGSPLAGRIEMDSAGTHDYHVGEKPDPRAIKHAALRGYDLSDLLARQISSSDLEYFDYVLAMDTANFRQLKAMCPTRLAQKIELLMDYGGRSDEHEVPDPYGGKPSDFEHALDLIEDGCRGLLAYLTDLQRIRASAKSAKPAVP